MKYIKIYIGSLIISTGILIVAALLVRAIGVTLPAEVADYILVIWFSLAVIIYPLSIKIVRV